MNIAVRRNPPPAQSAARPSRWRASALALVCAVLTLGVSDPAAAANAAAAANPAAATSATERLHALFRDSWQTELAADPLGANYLGDNRYNDRWPDLSAAGIRLNTVAPGLIDTPIYDAFPDPDAFKANLGQNVLFPKRLGRAEELASMVVECLTNSYMNGETIRVDGGIRMPPK